MNKIPKIKIVEVNGNHCVLVEKKHWLFGTRFIPLITYVGTNDIFYYSSFDSALEDCKKHFEWHILMNSQIKLKK